jgi:hypothetical protein
MQGMLVILDRLAVLLGGCIILISQISKLAVSPSTAGIVQTDQLVYFP